MKTYHLTLIACLTIIASAMLMAMYMLTDGVYFGVPMTLVNGGHVTTTAAIYYPGDDVEATVSYCKTRSIAGMIDWQLVDTYVRFYPASHANLPVGCHSYVMDLGKVPADVPADVVGETYHFTGLLTYKINSLTTVSFTLTSNTFIVVAH